MPDPEEEMEKRGVVETEKEKIAHDTIAGAPERPKKRSTAPRPAPKGAKTK